MITSEEEKRLIESVTEQVLLRLPEVVGNLMAANAMYSKLTKDFYKDHPDFSKHTKIVGETIERVEGKNPTLNYDEILKRAVPEIRKSISLKGQTDNKPADRNSLTLTLDNGSL